MEKVSNCKARKVRAEILADIFAQEIYSHEIILKFLTSSIFDTADFDQVSELVDVLEGIGESLQKAQTLMQNFTRKESDKYYRSLVEANEKAGNF